MSRDKIRILVLGNTGMLGYMVFKVLSADNHFRVFGSGLKRDAAQFYFDALSGIEGLEKICRRHKFDYFINCIGVTKNKIDESDPLSVARAIRINTLFPYELADLAARLGSRVIQISTDGVFSNNAGICYENSPCDSGDLYGKTKRLGEVNTDNFLNIRCSIMGPSPFEKGGLLEWFLSRDEGGVVAGYADHRWNGVTTLQYAGLCGKIISSGMFDGIVKESNVHHFCPNKAVSKYRLLILLKAAFNRKVKIIQSKNKKAAVRRVLMSRHKSIGRIFSHNITMKKAIGELSGLINNSRPLKK